VRVDVDNGHCGRYGRCQAVLGKEEAVGGKYQTMREFLDSNRGLSVVDECLFVC
jgi:hypothetical protein